MKRPMIIVGSVLIVAIVVGLVVLLRQKPPLGAELKVYGIDGKLAPTSTLQIEEEGTLDLRIAVQRDAYVYVYDEWDNSTSLMWAEKDAWKKGEYAADAPTFQGVGPHRIAVVASHEPIATPELWRAITSEAVRAACPSCELLEYEFRVIPRPGGSPPPVPPPPPEQAPTPGP